MKGGFLSFLCVVFGCLAVRAQSSSEIKAYIDKYSAIALKQEKEYGIPASITLAQGILESGAGTSQLTLHSNNHFGIKALGSWEGKVYYAWDDEPAKSKFRVYASAEESFRDHSRILKEGTRYSHLFRKSVYDYRAWATGLQAAGYATATNYAKALIGYIEAYSLYSVNGGVKLKPGKKVTIVEEIEEEIAVEPEAFEEEDSEAEEVLSIVERYVVEINEVRCTLLYPGQTLAAIAQEYDIPKYKLMEYNEWDSEREVKDGDVVYLNKKKKRNTGIQEYYKVKEGDTLHAVSQMFGIRVSSLARMNHKSPGAVLREGEKIRLK